MNKFSLYETATRKTVFRELTLNDKIQIHSLLENIKSKSVHEKVCKIIIYEYLKEQQNVFKSLPYNCIEVDKNTYQFNIFNIPNNLLCIIESFLLSL